jgi:prefoldin subunit 5
LFPLAPQNCFLNISLTASFHSTTPFSESIETLATGLARAPNITALSVRLSVVQDDIGSFISDNRTSLENVLEALSTILSKYKLLENGLVENRKALRAKIPDISASLDVVKMLEEKAGSGEDFSAFFALADNVHAKASISPKGVVCLWLGANVMLEYTYAEARALLETNLRNAEQKVEETGEELEILREQIITTEASLASERDQPINLSSWKTLTLYSTPPPPR